ncbi:MAG: hypothetical protein IID18_09775 [Nitrospinae bacterium]|nr:hypothetical protein [Nitrospinota bacterium]
MAKSFIPVAALLPVVGEIWFYWPEEELRTKKTPGLRNPGVHWKTALVKWSES